MIRLSLHNWAALPLGCLLAAGDVIKPLHAGAQPVYDGFNVYCTSNHDGTGVCTNMETSRNLDCIIIPGQVIDCKSYSGKSFQCVLYSQYTPNQAEFFCDPAVDQMLGQESAEGMGDVLTNPFSNAL
jgi:hypothetical protein